MSDSVNAAQQPSMSDAVNDSLPDSPPSRAPADQGTRELGNEGSERSEFYSPSIPTSSTSTREPRPDVDGWTPGDVVALDTSEVFGLMAADVVNPWVLLNEDREDGENFAETAYIEDCNPRLVARAGAPVTAGPVGGVGGGAPVVGGGLDD